MTFSIPDCFMIAFIVGLVFGLVYEALRIIRLILRFKAAIFVCDVAFFVLSAWAVCTLSKALGNYIRIYTVLGFGAGVFTYITTVGRLLNLAESAASIAWRSTIGRLIHATIKGFGCILDKLAHKIKTFFGKLNNFCFNILKKHSAHLKSTEKKLYNNVNGKNDKVNGEKNNVIKAKVRKSI